MRRVLLVLVLFAAVGAAGWLSSREPTRDSVGPAERELGIDLEQLWVHADQVDLRVVAAGPPEGQPVVLLHGFPELWYAWRRPLATLAAAGFRVYVPDQRGYGESEKPRSVADYTIASLATDVERVIEVLGRRSVFLVGHDWGGGVAWHVALGRPDLVARLAVIGTPHPYASRVVQSREERVSWYRTVFQIPWLPEWAAGVAHWRLVTGMLQRTALPGAFSDEDLAILRSAWAHDGSFGAMVNWYRASFRYAENDFFLRDGRSSIPTLVMVAPDDAFIPGDLTRASMQFLDDGRLVELERGSHWVIQEEPEEISRLLVEFFSDTN